MEIEVSHGQSGYVYGEAMGTGWLSSNTRSKDPEISQHSCIKNGKWNSYRIIAKGPRIQTFINGVKIEDITLKEAYKTHPEGAIGLQVHGLKEKSLKGAPFFEVRWRKLKIRDL